MEQDSLKLLPPRPKKAKDLSRLKGPQPFFTNLHTVSLKDCPSLEQFSLDVDPLIEDSEISLIRRLVRVKVEKLVQEVGFLSAKGRMLWGRRQSSKPVMVFQVEACKEKGILTNYTLVVKHVRSILYGDIFKLSIESQRQIFQVYNVLLREKLHLMGFRETSRGRFLLPGDQGLITNDNNYQALRSFDLRIEPLTNRLTLLVNVCFRVFNTFNAREEMMHAGYESYAVGRTVITTYNKRCYRVRRICFDKNPRTTFYNRRTGKEQPIFEYLEEFHKVQFKSPDGRLQIDLKQPLFQVLIGYEYKKGVKEEVLGYLVPQCCRFSSTMSQINQNPASRDSFKELSAFMHLSPQSRIEKQLEVIKKLAASKDSLEIEERPNQVEGYQAEIVVVANPKPSFKDRPIIPENGQFRSLKSILQPMVLRQKEWVLVHSTSGKEFQRHVYQLQESSKCFRIELECPQEVLMKAEWSVQEWIQRLGSLRGRGEVKVIVVLLSSRMKSSHYGRLKKFITTQLKRPCQMILDKTILNKNATTIFGKIALQINAKIGKALWSVKNKHPFWENHKVTCAGISVSRNLKQIAKQSKSKQMCWDNFQKENREEYVVSLVSTNNQDMTKTISNSLMIDSLKTLNDPKLYEELFTYWAKCYYAHNHNKFPKVFLLFQDGLAEKEARNRCQAQLTGFKAFQIRAKNKEPTYNPHLIIALAVKNSSKRVYDPRSRSGGKFRPAFENPEPGTIFFESISSEQVYDFHLAAHLPTKGTTGLTEFRIAYHSELVPVEAIAELTLEQCFNYPNIMGGIRVPGVLQSATKMSRMTGEHVHLGISNLSPSLKLNYPELIEQPWFL